MVAYLGQVSSGQQREVCSSRPHKRDGECESSQMGSCRWLGIAYWSCKHRGLRLGCSMMGSECRLEEEKHIHHNSDQGNRHQRQRFLDLGYQPHEVHRSQLGTGAELYYFLDR